MKTNTTINIKKYIFLGGKELKVQKAFSLYDYKLLCSSRLRYIVKYPIKNLMYINSVIPRNLRVILNTLNAA